VSPRDFVIIKWMALIDVQLWQESFSKPDWYIRVWKNYQEIEQAASKEDDYQVRKAIKSQVYELVEGALNSGSIKLADSGKDFDSERLPIDTVVIHHTGSKPGMSLSRLNAIQLLRIYATQYVKPSQEDSEIKGKAIWSNHFYFGKQVFWAYHWFVREDGTAERILNDEYIGWHAGNWDINKRSIAICFDDYLQDKQPSDKAINTAINIISSRYPGVKQIIGHREANPNTQCPGNLFLPTWKSKLAKAIS
jgi:hypothetical protein